MARLYGGGVGGGSSSPLTTKGDIWSFDVADNRFPVGAVDGAVLSVASAEAFGMKWIESVTILGSAGQVCYFTSSTTVEGLPDGTAGQVLSTDGAGNLSWITVGGGGGTPALPFNAVQFNNAGAFGGDATFTWDNVNKNLLVGLGSILGGFNSASFGLGVSNGGNNFVAGNTSAIGNSNFAGGEGNTITGDYNLVGGNEINVTSSRNVVGGFQNSVSQIDNVVGGRNNNVTGQGNAVFGWSHAVSGNINLVSGESITMSGTWSAAIGTGHNVGGGHSVAVGDGHQLPATNAFAAGSLNRVTNTNGAALGQGALATRFGEIAYTSKTWSPSGVLGEAQGSLIVGGTQSPDDTPREVELNYGVDQYVALEDSTSNFFEVIVVGRNIDTGAQSAVYKFEGLVTRGVGAATVAIFGMTKTTIYEDDTNWDANVDADTTNGRLRTTVTGVAATNIRWAAHYRLVQVKG